MTHTLSDMLSKCGVMIASNLLALVFLYSGQDKIRHWGEGVAEVAAMDILFSDFFNIATIVTQIGGSCRCNRVGLVWGALVLAAFTFLATLPGHEFWQLSGAAAKREFTTALEHVAMIGGFCS
jgi:transmembrane protein